MTRSESKYFATAARMDEALLELLGEKDLAFITVKEICTRAGVSRSTFYLHYETIGDLLDESLRHMQEQFWAGYRGELSAPPDLRCADARELLLITPDYLRPYLEFIRSHQRLYRATIERPAAFRSDEGDRTLFRTLIEPVMERFGVPAAERRYRAMFYLRGITGIIEEWLRSGCADDIEQMITVIQGCIPDAP